MRNKGSKQYSQLIHRPEEGLDLKSECIEVSAMVHLPQEWNFGSMAFLPPCLYMASIGSNSNPMFTLI